MCIRRIATISLVLLGYIALAGAAQNLISRFASKPTMERYAEVRVGTANQIQVLICKDWIPEADDPDLSQGTSNNETVQDLYYWINLQDNFAATSFSQIDFHANGPTQQRSYQGTVSLERSRNQLTINLQRVLASPGQPEQIIPCPANGTYLIRRSTKAPMLKPDFF